MCTCIVHFVCIHLFARVGVAHMDETGYEITSVCVSCVVCVCCVLCVCVMTTVYQEQSYKNSLGDPCTDIIL